MKKMHRLRQRLLDYFPSMIFGIAMLFCVATIYYFMQWREAISLNVAYDDQSILTHQPTNDNYLEAYSIGYLLNQNDKPNRALKAFEIAEATSDPHLKALAKHALGNLYLSGAESIMDDEHGSRRLVARILLAREAYKNALRIEPDLYASRFNLERLDRISPAKRGLGHSMTDGYTIGLDPFKQNGRALMKDNTRRGLP